MSATSRSAYPGAVVVTGASGGGLGHAVVLGLLRDGARVVASDHPSQRRGLDELVSVAGAKDLVTHPTDVSDEVGVGQLLHVAIESFGRIDTLVHCAGIILRKDVFSTTLDEWNRVLEVNLTGTWLLNRAIGRVLCNQKSGSIVNIASVYANRVGPLPESAYYASKAGVSNLTRALAAEFGASGVRVNCIAPGVFFPTGMTAPLKDSPATLEAMRQRTMLGRLGDPARDLDGVVRFLISPAARYITGQTIFVDGGWSAW